VNTVIKKTLIDQIVTQTNLPSPVVREVVQRFLDNLVGHLGKGHRIELRDFGIFEVIVRSARQHHNPKTLAPVAVPERRTVRFKVGRLMKLALREQGATPAATKPRAPASRAPGPTRARPAPLRANPPADA
jgi:nucleoid DNA-binding protein